MRTGSSSSPAPRRTGRRTASWLALSVLFVSCPPHRSAAARRAGFRYDSSIEEMVQPGPDGGGYRWPYPLDNGLPANRPPISPQPGLWEIPIYTYVVPPDADGARYGLASGTRDRLKTVRDYFEPANGEITGMDRNLWNEFDLTPAEFLGVLKYSLDRHLAGNRCPMTVGLHGELYTIRPDTTPARAALIRERRAAVAAFLDSALSKPEVRIINHRELLDWLTGPGLAQVQSRDAAAPGGFRDDFSGPELPLDPEGVKGWSFFTGEGRAAMDVRRGDGFASILVDATKDRRGVWYVISMTTRNFPARSGDTVNGQLALIDWGLGKYRLDIDYHKVDIVDVTRSGPDLGRWRASEGGNDIPLVSVGGTIDAVLRWSRPSVTWSNLIRGEPREAVICPRMIIDRPVSESDGAKTYLTISKPALQRTIDGKSPGIAIRALGALQAAFYSREYASGKFAARLLFNLAE